MLKKIVYVILTCVLGILVGYTIYGLTEFFYLNYSIAQGTPLVCGELTATLNGGLEFPPACITLIYLQYGLMIIGTLGGYIMGKIWYHQVYELKKGGFIKHLRKARRWKR